MTLRLLKIKTVELELGMYVAELDRPWLETSYALQGFQIKSQMDIAKLTQNTEYVFIDPDKSKGELSQQNNSDSDLKNNSDSDLTEDQKKQLLTNIKPRHYEDQTDFNLELEEAFGNHNTLVNAVANVMEDIAKNKKLKLPVLEKAVEPMIESVIRNSEAFSWLTMMKNRDEYTYNHSVSCSIWAVAFGRNLGLQKKELQSLALGALLFDVGKMKLPEKLINNPNRFTPSEFKQITKHVEHSVKIVKSIKGINDDVIQMVATHHERQSGNGYPKRLKGNHIPLFGKIAGIVDCYDALISHRLFATAISPHDAIRKLYEWSNIDFQAELIEQFIQIVGIYPVGTIIELSDGRIGVVVAHHRVWRLRPKIMLLLDTNKKPYASFDIIDIYTLEKGEDGKALNILKSVEPGIYGIDPKQFYL